MHAYAEVHTYINAYITYKHAYIHDIHAYIYAIMHTYAHAHTHMADYGGVYFLRFAKFALSPPRRLF